MTGHRRAVNEVLMKALGNAGVSLLPVASASVTVRRQGGLIAYFTGETGR